MLDNNSLAASVGSSVKNVQFQAGAVVIPRKNLIIGTYDAAKTLIVDEVPKQIFSAAEAGSLYGFGSMIHRLAVRNFEGSAGIPTYASPQAEAVAAAASAGTITFASTGTKAGTVRMYISGIPVPFTVAEADTAAEIATKAAAAITADKNLPVTAVVNATPEQIDIASKSKGPWGDDISLKFSILSGEEMPTGVSAIAVDMAGGTGIPDIQDAVDGLGTGDDANELFFTDVVHGYGQDATTLNVLSTYNGEGNDFVGCYSKTVARPFRVLTGDVVADTAGLSALIILGDSRKLDRTNGIIAVPGSASHPSEIAAKAIGYMSKINNNRAEESYIGVVLAGIDPGAQADRWTGDYDNRDNAVKAGISPTKINNGVVVLQNVVTFYHPDDVPVASNGYRSMRNISILQNILTNIKSNFQQEKWKGISIVIDLQKVTNINDRKKARDVDTVLDDLVVLAKSFMSQAWIYDDQFTIDKLKEAGAVVIRAGNTGFNNTVSVILSGEGGILDTVTEFDTSIDVLLN